MKVQITYRLSDSHPCATTFLNDEYVCTVRPTFEEARRDHIKKLKAILAVRQAVPFPEEVDI